LIEHLWKEGRKPNQGGLQDACTDAKAEDGHENDHFRPGIMASDERQSGSHDALQNECGDNSHGKGGILAILHIALQ
jgi:hypothetical protein